MTPTGWAWVDDPPIGEFVVIKLTYFNEDYAAASETELRQMRSLAVRLKPLGYPVQTKEDIIVLKQTDTEYEEVPSSNFVCGVYLSSGPAGDIRLQAEANPHSKNPRFASLRAYIPEFLIEGVY